MALLEQWREMAYDQSDSDLENFWIEYFQASEQGVMSSYLST